MLSSSDDVGTTIERHEAEAWAACVEATALVDNNALGADIARRGTSVLSTLAAFNFAAFNRVVALGVDEPARTTDLDAVDSFYASHSQTRYAIEVTPVSQPGTLAETLRARGLEEGSRIAKCWRTIDDLPDLIADVDVRELGVSDREQWASVNASAWEVPSFFAAWFGASIGQPGFRHFGIFDGDLLVSTGAIFVTGDVAWSGFSATRPSHRGHRYQIATHLKRLHEAAAMGCRVVHTETAAETPAAPNPSLRNQLRVGFIKIYEKEVYLANAGRSD